MELVELTDSSVSAVIERVDDLAAMNENTREDRRKIRALMDGDLTPLFGKEKGKTVDETGNIPIVNMFQTANDRLAQKLGRRPDVKIEPPSGNDSQRAREHAAKRVRVLEYWDKESKLTLQLPQQARWLSGYGFCVFTIKQKLGKNGEPFPHLSLRDPFNCYPGNLGYDQTPDDIAFAYTYTPEQLIRLYPEHKAALEEWMRSGGGVGATPPGNRVFGVGTASSLPDWTSPSIGGIDVYEYINKDGTWWIAPGPKLLLAYVPNPIGGQQAPFIFGKRFSFNKLRGQYDHLIGTLSGLAQLNTLSIQAAKDIVFAETNISGEVEGEYQRGRRAVNKLRPGSEVRRMSDNIPMEVFRVRDALEQQLRNGASYPITDDGNSPLSFVTGRGMDSLVGANDMEIKEYQTVLAAMMEEADSKRFMWIEGMYPERRLHIEGEMKGASFSETFVPNEHIRGHINTRRVYGIMAGFDEPNKLVGGTNLLSAGVIDVDTFRENIDGLENHDKIEKRIRQKKVEDGLFAVLGARAEQGDPQVLTALIRMLEEGDMKSLLEEVFAPPEEEPGMEEMGMGMGMGMEGMEGVAGMAPVPDVQTVLSQLRGGEEPMMGVQSVGRV